MRAMRAKRQSGDILYPESEPVGEVPILDEIYSMMRPGQNRAHSLALEIKRMYRLRERMEKELKEFQTLKTENARLELQIVELTTERDQAKAKARELELEVMRLTR
jgi:hypothetical protein